MGVDREEFDELRNELVGVVAALSVLARAAPKKVQEEALNAQIVARALAREAKRTDIVSTD